jgi:hypothetical protein
MWLVVCRRLPDSGAGSVIANGDNALQTTDNKPPTTYRTVPGAAVDNSA